MRRGAAALAAPLFGVVRRPEKRKIRIKYHHAHVQLCALQTASHAPRCTPRQYASRKRLTLRGVFRSPSSPLSRARMSAKLGLRAPPRALRVNGPCSGLVHVVCAGRSLPLASRQGVSLQLRGSRGQSACRRARQPIRVPLPTAVSTDVFGSASLVQGARSEAVASVPLFWPTGSRNRPRSLRRRLRRHSVPTCLGQDATLLSLSSRFLSFLCEVQSGP